MIRLISNNKRVEWDMVAAQTMSTRINPSEDRQIRLAIMTKQIAL